MNDFIYCPRSIYFHQLYTKYQSKVYQGKVQLEGQIAHKAIDNRTYSSKKSVLMGQEVVSEKYKLYGKIDLFLIDKKELRERKRSIKKIYDGYVFQAYAQYFALTEMGYDINRIFIYDISKNKSYPILLPHNDKYMFNRFEATIKQINNFSLFNRDFTPLLYKCEKCIYSELCDHSLC